MNQESQINVEIRQIIVEIMPKIQPDFQLEVVRLNQQVNRINHLIYHQKKGWIKRLFYRQVKELELLLWLTEVKNILLAIQEGSLGREVAQEFRLNLTKYLNQCEYALWGRSLNTVVNFYYHRSNPAKIALGLMITSLLAIGALSILSYFHLNHLKTERLISLSTPSKTINNLPNQKNERERLNLKKTKSTKNIYLWLLYSGIAGVLGSVTSILLRIVKFHHENFDDPLIPVLIGLLKPIIGLMLGIFICALMNSDIIFKLDVLFPEDSSSLIVRQKNRNRRLFFIFSCAFIIGFSERLAADLLSKTESHLVSSGTATPKKFDETS